MVAKTSFSKYEIERNKPMPSLNHGSIQANLSGILYAYRKKIRTVSELRLRLAPDNWESVPDISIFPKIILDFDKDVIAVTKPPIVAIEILSPTQSISELTIKAKAYFEHGVKSCWIIIPEFKNIYVLHSLEDYQIFRHTDMIVDKHLGISFSLKEVFE